MLEFNGVATVYLVSGFDRVECWKLARGYHITGPVEEYQCHLPRDRGWDGMPTARLLDPVN